MQISDGPSYKDIPERPDVIAPLATFGELRAALAAFDDAMPIAALWDTCLFEVVRVVSVAGWLVLDVDTMG